MAELPTSAPEQSAVAAVSSLPEVLAQLNGALNAMPPEALDLWLPGVQTPAGWIDTTAVATAPVARMLVRRAGGSGPWDASEMLNLYRVPGQIPPDTVLNNADRALRCGGATDIHTYRRDDVPTAFDGLLAIRASGRLTAGSREVHAIYNYYAINTPAGAALIEQAAVVGADAPAALAVEVECLAESVFESLLMSLHTGTNAGQPVGLLATGSAIAAGTPEHHLMTSTAIERAAAVSRFTTRGTSPEDPLGRLNVGTAG